MEKMSRILILVAAITLALICVANSKVVSKPGTSNTEEWCICKQNTKHCKQCKENTYAGDPQDKSKYYQCSSDRCYYVMSCPKTLEWDQNTTLCDKPVEPKSHSTDKTDPEISTTTSLHTEKLTTDEKPIVADYSSSQITDAKTTSTSYDTSSSGRQTSQSSSQTGHHTQSPAKTTTAEPIPSSSEEPAGWCYCNKTSDENCKPCKPGVYMGDSTDSTKFYHCGSSECFLTKYCENNTVWNQKNTTCIHGVWTTNTATSKGTSATATTAKFNTGDLSSITITPTEMSTPSSSDRPLSTTTATVHTTEDISSTTDTPITTATGTQTEHPTLSTSSPSNKTTNTTPESHTTNTPTSNHTTITPANHTTIEPANYTTSEPSNHTTITPANHTTIEPANYTTSEPSNHTTITPANHTTIEPGNHTTVTPGHQTTSHQPTTTEQSSFDGASFGGGIAAGVGIAILLLALIYLFYYCRKPNPGYEEL